MQAITPDCPSLTQSFYLKECQTHALPSGLEEESHGVIGMEATAKALLSLEAWSVLLG